MAHCLADRVPDSVLQSAQLLVSELATNSLHHSGVTVGEDLIVRVSRGSGSCWLEVEDAREDGVIVPQAPDLVRGKGMGLNVVQALSKCWGVVRAAKGPTRVWAQTVMRV